MTFIFIFYFIDNNLFDPSPEPEAINIAVQLTPGNLAFFMEKSILKTLLKVLQKEIRLLMRVATRVCYPHQTQPSPHKKGVSTSLLWKS